MTVLNKILRVTQEEYHNHRAFFLFATSQSTKGRAMAFNKFFWQSQSQRSTGIFGNVKKISWPSNSLSYFYAHVVFGMCIHVYSDIELIDWEQDVIENIEELIFLPCAANTP